MRPIREAWCGHIDITNFCGRGCIYCTRYDRHLAGKRYHMEVSYFKKALYSYKGFPGFISIMGGEPLSHPNFHEFCTTALGFFPKSKLILFTSVPWWVTQHKTIIEQTYATVIFHPKTSDRMAEGLHQPITIAIKDVIKDENLRNEMIDDCWMQRRWCPAITNDGAYFCEAGASLGKLMGIKGWDVDKDPGWWTKDPDQFGRQKEICQLCGAAVPMARQSLADQVEKISPSFAALLSNRKKYKSDFVIFDQEITVEDIKRELPGWTPGIYKREQYEESFNWSTIDWDRR